MYCSSCGVAVAANLTCCNHCGAKINSDKADSLAKTTELRRESMIISSIAALFVCGLVAISILLGVMKAVLHFDVGPLLGFAFLSFFILIALEVVYILRFYRRERDTDRTPEGFQPPKHNTKELGDQSRGFGEPVNSVTDHTTRTLDPIYSGRK